MNTIQAILAIGSLVLAVIAIYEHYAAKHKRKMYELWEEFYKARNPQTIHDMLKAREDFERLTRHPGNEDLIDIEKD